MKKSCKNVWWIKNNVVTLHRQKEKPTDKRTLKY